jgi:hypothetical protein
MANSFLVSTNSISEELNFQLFPNPSTGNFRINFNNDIDKNKNISILDVTGKLILEKNSINQKATEINANDLTNGIYFVKVTSNEKITINKVILQK